MKGQARAYAGRVSRLLRARLGRGATRWTRHVEAAGLEVLDALFDALVKAEGKDAMLAVLEGRLGPRPARRRPATRSPRA